MVNSRRKGKDGELELVNICKDHGLDAQRTAPMQRADDDSFPDVTAKHSSGLTIAIEAKSRKTLPSKKHMDAMEQADAAFPDLENVARVVAMREFGKPGSWVFSMRGSTFFDLIGRLQPTEESSK